MNRAAVVSIVGVAVLILFIGCSSPDSDSITYERVWIETFHADLLEGAADTAITLFDSTGTQIDQNDEADYETLDHTGGLTSGDYYIRITTGGFTGTFDNYGIRVFTLALVDPDPAAAADFGNGNANLTDAPHEPDDTNPWSGGTPTTISIGDPGLNRYLGALGDVDFVKLVLP